MDESIYDGLVKVEAGCVDWIICDDTGDGRVFGRDWTGRGHGMFDGIIAGAAGPGVVGEGRWDFVEERDHPSDTETRWSCFKVVDEVTEGDAHSYWRMSGDLMWKSPVDRMWDSR